MGASGNEWVGCIKPRKERDLKPHPPYREGKGNKPAHQLRQAETGAPAKPRHVVKRKTTKTKTKNSRVAKSGAWTHQDDRVPELYSSVALGRPLYLWCLGAKSHFSMTSTRSLRLSL